MCDHLTITIQCFEVEYSFYKLKIDRLMNNCYLINTQIRQNYEEVTVSCLWSVRDPNNQLHDTSRNKLYILSLWQSSSALNWYWYYILFQKAYCSLALQGLYSRYSTLHRIIIKQQIIWNVHDVDCLTCLGLCLKSDSLNPLNIITVT